MMLPIIINGENMINTMNAILGTEHKIGGIVLARESGEKAFISDSLYKVGVSAKFIKITPVDNNTYQAMITALKRFTLTQVIQDEPIIRWKVSHYYGDENIKPTQELKTYSMAIIASIKELIKSNSLFHEELKLSNSPALRQHV